MQNIPARRWRHVVGRGLGRRDNVPDAPADQIQVVAVKASDIEEEVSPVSVQGADDKFGVASSQCRPKRMGGQSRRRRVQVESQADHWLTTDVGQLLQAQPGEVGEFLRRRIHHANGLAALGLVVQALPEFKGGYGADHSFLASLHGTPETELLAMAGAHQVLAPGENARRQAAGHLVNREGH